jgi:hypothetical protein
MERAKRDQFQFKEILVLLHEKTNRYEASFASKLAATINPSMPVIDSIVLKNIDLRLPYPNATHRTAKISNLYIEMISIFTKFIDTENGKYLVDSFTSKYPNAGITKVKMVDFVLWKTRDS